eukprot:scaffold4440_cov109-Isochrysis_galbana.AAC.3
MGSRQETSEGVWCALHLTVSSSRTGFLLKVVGRRPAGSGGGGPGAGRRGTGGRGRGETEDARHHAITDI